MTDHNWQRLPALSALFRRFGYISMQTSEDAGLRMARMPIYMEVFTDLTPQPQEMDRFYVRHGHTPPPA